MSDEFYYSVDNEEQADAYEEPIIQTAPAHSFLDAYTADLAKARANIAQYKGLQRKIATDQVVVQLYERWVQKFGFKEKQIKEHLDFEESKLDANFKTSYSFRELLEASREAGEWLVPSFFQPSSLYVFFSGAKVGKSSLMLDLKYATLRLW
jgi:hypothetical protein